MYVYNYVGIASIKHLHQQNKGGSRSMQYTLSYRNVQNSSVLRFEHTDIVDINHLIYIQTLLGHSVKDILAVATTRDS